MNSIPSSLLLIIRISILAIAILCPRFDSYAGNQSLEELRALVNAESISRTVQDLFGFGTRYEFTEGRRNAADYLYKRFQVYCQNAEYDYYHFEEDSEIYESANVIGIIHGSGISDSVIVIGAHYDSYSDEDPLNFAPGADDNASGVAG